MAMRVFRPGVGRRCGPLMIRAIVLAIVALSPAYAATVEGAAPVRIVCLGDSITQSDYAHYSYRYGLWKKLIDSGASFDLVGSMTHNWNNSTTPPSPQDPVWPTYGGLSFDQDHDGHWGYRVDQILDGRNDREPYPGYGKLSDWLAGYTADAALVHLGTNDAFQGVATSTTIAKLGQVIDALRNDNPSIIILLAKVIPHTGDITSINNLNGQIPVLVASKNTSQSPIYVVDQFTGFNASTDTFDGVHPNATGEGKMAQKWFDALRDDVFVPEPATLALIGLGAGVAVLHRRRSRG